MWPFGASVPFGKRTIRGVSEIPWSSLATSSTAFVYVDHRNAEPLPSMLAVLKGSSIAFVYVENLRGSMFSTPRLAARCCNLWPSERTHEHSCCESTGELFFNDLQFCPSEFIIITKSTASADAPASAACSPKTSCWRSVRVPSSRSRGYCGRWRARSGCSAR